MEKKVNKRAPVKAKVLKDDDVVLELDSPFAERVSPLETSVPLKAQEKPAAKTVRKTVKKAAIPRVGADPFAETADAVSTKKPAVKIRKVKAKPAVATSPVALAEPVSETPKPKKRVVKKKVVKKVDLDVTAEIAATEPEVQLSPAFKALADVALPELTRDNRARLLMQSPTKLYFYWSLRDNPWQQLRHAFGPDTGSYSLVLKLTNSRTGSEELFPAEAEGERWFDVGADGEYRVEIGFYAPNRPYFRIVYSNVVETPRRTPSPHPASDARWTVSATKFSEVLDVAGFTRDAVEVAMVGDDVDSANDATRSAYTRFTGSENGIEGVASEDVRHTMLAIAGGASLDDLRHQVSASLLTALQSKADKLTTAGARAALGEYFDIDESEWTEHETGSAVFGASLVHFPKTLKSRNLTSRYNPISSRGR